MAFVGYLACVRFMPRCGVKLMLSSVELAAPELDFASLDK